MFFQPWLAIKLVILTFAIRDSMQAKVTLVADWASFETIYKGTTGPVMLYVTQEINDDNWTVLQEYCGEFTKCSCYYGMEPKGSTFDNQFHNKLVPMLAFYNHGKHQTSLMGKLKSKVLTAEQITAGFNKICPN